MVTVLEEAEVVRLVLVREEMRMLAATSSSRLVDVGLVLGRVRRATVVVAVDGRQCWLLWLLLPVQATRRLAVFIRLLRLLGSWRSG